MRHKLQSGRGRVWRIRERGIYGPKMLTVDICIVLIHVAETFTQSSLQRAFNAGFSTLALAVHCPVAFSVNLHQTRNNFDLLIEAKLCRTVDIKKFINHGN